MDFRCFQPPSLWYFVVAAPHSQQVKGQLLPLSWLGTRKQMRGLGTCPHLPPVPIELALNSDFQIPYPVSFPLSHKYLPSYLSKHPQKVYLIWAFQIFQVINGIYILSILNSSPIPKAEATVSTECRVSISYKLSALQLSLFPLLLFHPVFLHDEFCPCDSFSS